MHDVFYWTGVLWWGVVAGAGTVLILIGAIQVLLDKVRHQRAATRERFVHTVVEGGASARNCQPSPSLYDYTEGA